MENNKNVKGYSCTAECNGPKAVFIREFNSWFMTEQIDQIMSVLDEEIVWEMVGEVTIDGLEDVRKSFAEPHDGDMQMIEMKVDGILTDGLWGCSFGTMNMSNGDEYSFNDVIRFKEGEEIKIDKLKSFIIKLNE